MCSAPDIEAPPPPAERQAMQTPEQGVTNSGLNRKRRRGMWASIFTSPQGAPTMPSVTGGGGSFTGG